MKTNLILIGLFLAVGAVDAAIVKNPDGTFAKTETLTPEVVDGRIDDLKAEISRIDVQIAQYEAYILEMTYLKMEKEAELNEISEAKK